MNTFLRKNFALLAAFALPVLLIIGIGLSVYIPSVFVSTKYDFIYATCPGASNYFPYYCTEYLNARFTVENEKLTVNDEINLDLNGDNIKDDTKIYISRIYLHDTDTNQSKEISLEDAQKLSLNGLTTSPDGVTLSGHENHGGGGFFPFDGGNYSYGYYLMDGKGKKKMNIILDKDHYYYDSNFRFIGWVLPAENN